MSSFDNLEEMGKFPEKCNPLNLNQEKIENLNTSLTNKKIEKVIKSLPKKKSLGH
jgi:hypothetical protein